MSAKAATYNILVLRKRLEELVRTSTHDGAEATEEVMDFQNFVLPDLPELNEVPVQSTMTEGTKRKDNIKVTKMHTFLGKMETKQRGGYLEKLDY